MFLVVHQLRGSMQVQYDNRSLWNIVDISSTLSLNKFLFREFHFIGCRENLEEQQVGRVLHINFNPRLFSLYNDAPKIK